MIERVTELEFRKRGLEAIEAIAGDIDRLARSFEKFNKEFISKTFI